MFKIRCFNQQIDCDSIENLKLDLSSRFRGDSVSIEYTSQSGIKKTVFVDVNGVGEVFHSYGKGQLVNFELLQ